MCGILFRYSKEGRGCINEIFHGGISEGGSYIWECSDELWIGNFVERHHQNETRYTESVDRKLQNITIERELHQKLGKIKNTIAKTPEIKDEIQKQIKEINDEINALNIEVENYQQLLELKVKNSGTFNWPDFVANVASRGPNYILYQKLEFESSLFAAEMFSSVLSLRQPFLSQPIEITGDWGAVILQFNGELYNQDCFELNDTQYFAKKLSSLIAEANNNVEEGILETITALDGEFAYVIFHTSVQDIYFGRDYIGKRSLIYKESCGDGILISSVGDGSPDFIECESGIIYRYSNGKLTKNSFVGRHEINVNTEMNSIKVNKSEISDLIDSFDKVFTLACETRLKTIHPLHDTTGECHIGILFSGGLDCTVIAGIFGKIIQQEQGINSNKVIIDLLTVGFDNPRTQTLSGDSPDRKLARKSFEELAKKFNCEHLEFHLVEIDVTFEEWLRNKEKVQKLILPCDTGMDLSIAIAFYFASKGCGTRISLQSDDEFCEVKNFESKSLVLFSGLGADELFAGYLRHELIFTSLPEDADSETLQRAFDDLGKDLTHDILVIYKRNLGRDDRAMSCWGKELRYPYLDEQVIRHVTQNVPIDTKFKFSWVTRTNKKGKTTTRMDPIRKWFLREYADINGMEWVKDELKRAIQFGAKSAKIQVGQSKTKGTDVL